MRYEQQLLLVLICSNYVHILLSNIWSLKSWLLAFVNLELC